MKVHLQLKQAQHLALTPQLQQSIRLLQLSTLDLDQELEKFLMDNPMLERADPEQEDRALPQGLLNGTTTAESGPTHDSPEPSDAAESWQDDTSWSPEDTPGASWQDPEDNGEYPHQCVGPITLLDHLSAQLRLMALSDRDHQLITLLLSHLDESGYLQQSLDEIIAANPSDIEPIEPGEIQVALRLLQSLDPVGVGARDLSECLTLQLQALPAPDQACKAALSIVKDHLPLLAARDHTRLRKALGLSEDLLRAAHKLITQLDPKPGAAFNLSETRYVIPDVLVRKQKEHWIAQLNRDAMPRLRINSLYAGLMKSGAGSSNTLNTQLQEARWLIKNVQQRFDTILKVSQAIVDRQQAFLEHGEVAMRPLVLREIADILGLHESTISRVTSQKYMMTPRGLFELKYFFSSHVSTDTGGAASSTAIRALIRQLIAAEDRKSPLSDSQISDILAKQGLQVARRTVAKYREAMQIHSASQRKTL